MNREQQQHLFNLFAACSDNSITAQEHEELMQWLRDHPIARRMWFIHQDMELGLRNQRDTLMVDSSRARTWPLWAPFAATAVGLVIGLFSTSLVYAYFSPGVRKALTLLEENFEFGTAPLVTGTPGEAGYWSGDHSEVVGEQQGVKPKNGSRMLRFLRADFEGKGNLQPSRTSSLLRLVDLRPYRHEFQDGSVVAELSAMLNSSVLPIDRSYFGFVQIHALDAATAATVNEQHWTELNSSAIALTRSAGVELDRIPSTWQRIDCEQRVPAHTDFLLIEIGLKQMPMTRLPAEFADQYLDEVRLSLVRRPLLP